MIRSTCLFQSQLRQLLKKIEDEVEIKIMMKLKKKKVSINLINFLNLFNIAG
jgi:hypothetical protein